MGDGGVAGLEERLANVVANAVTFGVDGVDIEGKVRGECIEDGARVDGINVRVDGSEGGAESNLAKERVRIKSGKRRERDGGGRGARTEGKRGKGRLAGGGSDGGVGELDHGEEDEGGNKH